MASKVISWINNKEAQNIYAAFDSNMKKALGKDAFFSMTETQIYPLIPFATEKYMGQNGPSNLYLLKTAAAMWSLQVAVNKQNEIIGLYMAPAKTQTGTPVADNGSVWHDNALSTKLDSLVHHIALSKMQQTITPAMSIGVLNGLKANFYNYGKTNLVDDLHPLSTTLYEIGSITKTFTAFILADAVVNKKVSLEDPITKFLPPSVASNSDLQAISLKQLANHSSGLPRLPSNAFEGANMADPYVNYDTSKLFTFLKSFKAVNKPGEKYVYSNLGFGLLGVILENIYQQPLETLYQQIIFTPFKMKSSYSGRVKDSSVTAIGYNGKKEPTSYWNFTSMAGAGSIKSNTEDLLRYALQFTMKPRTNSKTDPRIAMLESITFQKDYKNVSLAWHLENPGKPGQIMNHNGGTGGFRTEIDICADKKMAVVVLCNSGAETNASAAASEILKQVIKE